MKRTYDYLVIGSGIAGLSFALKVAKAGSVAIITKEKVTDSSTSQAQGGIASVFDELDSFDFSLSGENNFMDFSLGEGYDPNAAGWLCPPDHEVPLICPVQ